MLENYIFLYMCLLGCCNSLNLVNVLIGCSFWVVMITTLKCSMLKKCISALSNNVWLRSLPCKYALIELSHGGVLEENCDLFCAKNVGNKQDGYWNCGGCGRDIVYWILHLFRQQTP